jgi:hypothetical protein
VPSDFQLRRLVPVVKPHKQRRFRFLVRHHGVHAQTNCSNHFVSLRHVRQRNAWTHLPFASCACCCLVRLPHVAQSRTRMFVPNLLSRNVYAISSVFIILLFTSAISHRQIVRRAPASLERWSVWVGVFANADTNAACGCKDHTSRLRAPHSAVSAGCDGASIAIGTNVPIGTGKDS